MTRLEALRGTSSLADLAKLLHYTPKGLAYVLYKRRAAHYRTFTIPKAGGGQRTICAPEPQLRVLQSRLTELLVACEQEIEAGKPDRKRVSHGFHKGRSIVTNARAHRKKRYVYNLDLKDFFGTINFGRVRGFFIADQNFELNPAVATVLAQIACHDNSLPQGAATSPVVANLVGHILDFRLIRLAREYGCTYTRYADDLTFSTNRRTFPRQLAHSQRLRSGKWVVGRQLRNAIKQAGFLINPSKTRMQIQGSRQEATGLIINEKVNISQEYYRNIRSMCFSLFQKGEYFIPSRNNDDSPEHMLRNTALIEGRLAHIYYVKARRDLSDKDKKNNRFVVPKAPVALYRQFLFFKYFVDPERPVIVTEGKTDIIHLRLAIRALNKDFPLLVCTDQDNLCLNVSFLNPSTVNQKILSLGEGFGGMATLLKEHRSRLKPYRYRPLSHAILLIVDNDTGGKGVIKAAEKASKKTIPQAAADPFFHIASNLYLVKTPPGADGAPSEIENCYPDHILNSEIGGKKLDLKKKRGDETSLSKTAFAEKVVRPAAENIDFSGFSPILEGVTGAISDYAKRQDGAADVAKSA